MAKQQQINIMFPLAGLDRQGAYRQQKPYSSFDLLNVRPYGILEGRERGGSRPGLIQTHVDDIGSNVRLLAPMTLSLGDNFTSWSDTFGGTELADVWTQAAWASDSPSISSDSLATVDTTVSDAAVVRDSLPIDSNESYTVEMFLAPYAGDFHGKYSLFMRMDNSSPDVTQDGVVVELQMGMSDQDTGDYRGTVITYSGGSPYTYYMTSGSFDTARAGWLSATVSGDTVTVYWCGVELISQSVDSHSGLRVGFGLECTEDGGVAQTDVFRVQYYSTGSVDALRSLVVASAGGDLYYESTYGRLTQLSTDLTLRDDTLLTAAQSGQKLYIADYGDVRASGTDGSVDGTDLTATGVADWSTLGIDTDDDVVVISNVQGSAVAGTYEIDSVAAGQVTLASSAGTGDCSYRIERAPKVYDPSTDTLSLLTATTGQVPTGCPLICHYLDRIVLAGAEIAPHVWYMSRQGDEEDWDYSQTDSQRAVAGTSSDAGVPGSAITALIPHSDDYLIMGCRYSLWRLRGDPAYGGQLDALSRAVGIVDRNAWCLGPEGELIFLSLAGLYVLPPGGDAVPLALSRDVLPSEFKNIDPDTTTPHLEYDTQNNGVHIYLTSSSPSTRKHWWLDWDRKRFWPLTLADDHEPTATCALHSQVIEESGVILGGRDGVLRRTNTYAADDAGTVFTSKALIGPIALAADSQEGILATLDAVVAEDSAGSVSWQLQPALTFEAAVSASASDSGTWNAGLNATVRPACRGQAFCLQISETSGYKWAFEQATATIRPAGRRRIT